MALTPMIQASMNMQYRQLTLLERYQIQGLYKAGFSQSVIARPDRLESGVGLMCKTQLQSSIDRLDQLLDMILVGSEVAFTES